MKFLCEIHTTFPWNIRDALNTHPVLTCCISKALWALPPLGCWEAQAGAGVQVVKLESPIVASVFCTLSPLQYQLIDRRRRILGSAGPLSIGCIFHSIRFGALRKMGSDRWNNFRKTGDEMSALRGNLFMHWSTMPCMPSHRVDQNVPNCHV